SWINQKLHVSKKLEQNIKLYYNQYYNDSNVDFICIILGIITPEISHSNAIIINIKTLEIERFEPNGFSSRNTYDYNSSLLDIRLYEFFTKLLSQQITYIGPNKTSMFGPQAIESILKTGKETHGSCTLWSLWYI